MPAGAWTWLEVAKLLASLSIPVALLLLGLALERRKVANQELTKKRIAVYDQVAPRLNDIMCFYRAVGHWASLDPDKIITAKREADRQMHVYRALFSQEFFSNYQAFMNLCFETYSDPRGGMPAKLRIDRAHVCVEMGARWDDAWSARCSDEPTPVAAMSAAYVAVMAAFAREIGVD